jgi:hypothetical protein
MLRNLERMKHAITEWAIQERILDDAEFHSQQEWNARGENIHEDALLILTIDSSGLYHHFNFGCDTEEFDDLVESFGFSYELGYQWSIGFFPLENYDYKRLTGTYTQKLRDARWLKKSELVKSRAGNCCQDCNATTSLDAHHCYYTSMREGYEPWEYPLSALRALCRECHTKRPIQEIRIRALTARLTQNQLNGLIDGLENSFNRFETESFLEFMNEVSFHDHLMKSAIAKLKKNIEIYSD